MSDYSELFNYMRDAGYENVNGYEFYQDIFPNCEESGSYHSDYSRPNAIYLYFDKERQRLRRRIMLKDTWQDDYMEYVEENPLTLCSGLMYRGRANKLNNAQQINALIFDLDGVGQAEFKVMEARWGVESGAYRSIPRPTYTVLSGTGIHLYYVFEEPIALYPNIKTQLKSMKYDLTFSIWEYGETSSEETIQYQSINQSFRMPGSYNEKQAERKRLEAFRTGERVRIDYLNKYVVDPKNRVDIEKPFKPTQTTRKEAQEKYPDWYERVISPQIEKRRIEEELQSSKVNSKKRVELEHHLAELRSLIRRNTKRRWLIEDKVNGDDPYALYHWWIGRSAKVKSGEKPDIKRLIKGGHRYYFLMCMAIYAAKCNVPRAKLVTDMKDIFGQIASIPHKNPLTEADMHSALEAYNKEYYDTSLKEINYWTGVGIEKNKRNGRSQKRHLEIIRADKRDMKESGRAFKNPEGRPRGKSKQRNQIEAYRRQRPDATPQQCMTDTKISKNTVYKWWNL